MKTVNELFAMQNIMTECILDGNGKEFIFNGVPFSREEWIEWCEEQEGVRFCESCGELMTDGYLVGGSDTYCSMDCLETALPMEDVAELKFAIENDLEYDDDDLFYTEWEEEL